MDSAARWAVTETGGALVTFTGLVRNHSADAAGGVAIEDEAYRSVAPERLEAIACKGPGRKSNASPWHRTGLVTLSQPSVLVAASAHHRADSFEVAQFCIDVVKQALPVWKNDHAVTSRGWVTTGVDPLTVDEAADTWFASHVGGPDHVS